MDRSESLGPCFNQSIRNSYEIPEKKRYIPVVIHKVFPQGRHYRGLYNGYIQRGMVSLNQIFAPNKMEFYVQDVRDISDNYLSKSVQERNLDLGIQFPDGGDASCENQYKVEMAQDNFEEYFKATVEKTAASQVINIYVLPEYERDGSGFAMSAVMDEFIDKDLGVIVVRFNDVINSDEVFAHEMGHIFGLLHTHKEKFKTDKGSCHLDNDSLCDTPFDPGFYDEESNVRGCEIDENCKIVSCGDPKYLKNPPDPRNIMGYYDGCGDSLSREQRQVINCNLELEKPYLIKDKPKTEVDLKHKVEVGCDDSSFVSIQEAVDEVIEYGGGTVQICEGVYHELINVHGLQFQGRSLDSSVIDLTIEAKTNESEDVEQVIIDGDFERGFVSSECSSSFEAGCVDVMFSGITFRHGVTQSEPLFDLSSAEIFAFYNVRVLDSESWGITAISSPMKEGSVLLNSTFEGIGLGNDSSLFLMNDSYLEMNCITFSDVDVFDMEGENSALVSAYHLNDQQYPNFIFENLHFDSVGVPFLKMVGYSPLEKPGLEDFYYVQSKVLRSNASEGNCDISSLKCERFVD